MLKEEDSGKQPSDADDADGEILGAGGG